MTKPNPVVEALEQVVNEPGLFSANLKRCQEALPLAREMAEKMGHYDELVEYKEAFEFLRSQYPSFFREVLLDMSYYHERAWPKRLTRMIEGKT